MATAPISQVLDDIAVGLPDRTGQCATCGIPLHERARISATAYRDDIGRWYMSRVHCRRCKDSLRPTRGRAEALVHATLIQRSTPSRCTHQLALGDIEVIEFSSTADGVEG